MSLSIQTACSVGEQPQKTTENMLLWMRVCNMQVGSQVTNKSSLFYSHFRRSQRLVWKFRFSFFFISGVPFLLLCFSVYFSPLYLHELKEETLFSLSCFLYHRSSFYVSFTVRHFLFFSSSAGKQANKQPQKHNKNQTTSKRKTTKTTSTHARRKESEHCFYFFPSFC